MTDETQPPDGLGPPPQPSDASRERAITAALAHFDELMVEGVLTPAGPTTTADEADMGDELARHRRAKGRRRGTPQRWLAAAAVLLVLGVGGALVSQLVGGSDDQTTSQASDQAEASAASTEAPAQADQSESGAGQAEPKRAAADTSKPAPAAVAAPGADGAAPGSLPEWLCELTARLGLDVCAP